MQAWETLLSRCAGMTEQCRRLRWLALWLIAKYSLNMWLSALAAEAKR